MTTATTESYQSAGRAPSHRPPRRFRPPAAAAAAGLFAAACAAPIPPAPAPSPVHTATVQASTAQRARTFAGVARANKEWSLSFRVDGTITGLAVGTGDRVRAGDLIASLDPVDYELRMNGQEAGLRQAEARAVSAEADLRRARRQYENNDGALAELEAAMSAVDLAAARVEAMAQRLEMAERQVAYTRMTAPAPGVILAILAEANEHVAPGQPVVLLASGGAPEVEFTVAETLIGRIREGARATVAFNAAPGERFDGVVAEVGVTTTATGTTFPATVRLDHVASHIRSGMTAEVRIAFAEEQPDRLVVPTRAVGADRTGPFVFVTEEAAGNRTLARRRAVTVGAFLGGGLEIVDGLSAGEVIVSAGTSGLRDGDEVRFTARSARLSAALAN